MKMLNLSNQSFPNFPVIKKGSNVETLDSISEIVELKGDFDFKENNVIFGMPIEIQWASLVNVSPLSNRLNLLIHRFKKGLGKWEEKHNVVYEAVLLNIHNASTPSLYKFFESQGKRVYLSSNNPSNVDEIYTLEHYIDLFGDYDEELPKLITSIPPNILGWLDGKRKEKTTKKLRVLNTLPVNITVGMISAKYPDMEIKIVNPVLSTDIIGMSPEEYVQIEHSSELLNLVIPVSYGLDMTFEDYVLLLTLETELPEFDSILICGIENYSKWFLEERLSGVKIIDLKDLVGE